MKFNIYIKKQKINSSYSEIIEEYKKRLSPYCNIKLITVKNENQLKKINFQNSCSIFINSNAKGLTSQEFASKISGYGVRSISTFNIFMDIDGDFPGENFSLCLLSISPDMGIRLAALYEQIYRVFKILRGEPYHK